MQSTDTWEHQELRVAGLAEPISHYTDAVIAGPLVFVSGCAPVDSDGNVVSDDVREQARRVHENLKLALVAAGSDLSRITKVTVFLTDINDRAAVNEIRQQYFGAARPASTLVEVSALAIPGMKVEIEAIAVRSGEGLAPGGSRG
jgi:reactive intermediate/imine deaminase